MLQFGTFLISAIKTTQHNDSTQSVVLLLSALTTYGLLACGTIIAIDPIDLFSSPGQACVY